MPLGLLEGDANSTESIANMLDACGICSSGFLPDFFDFLVSKFIMYEMDNQTQQNCIQWLSGYAKEHCKNSSKLEGYFFRSVYKTNLVDQFVENNKKTKQEAEFEETKKFFICPSCGQTASVAEGCVCGLSFLEMGDKTKVEFYKKLHALSPEKRQSYDDEQSLINEKYHNSPIGAWANLAKQRVEIDRKYGLIDSEDIDGSQSVD